MILWYDEEPEELEEENQELECKRMEGYVTLLYHPDADGFIDILPRDMLSVMLIATTTPTDQEPVDGWYRCCSVSYAEWLLSSITMQTGTGAAIQLLPCTLKLMLQRRNVAEYIKIDGGDVYVNARHFQFGDKCITGVKEDEGLLRISLYKKLIRGLIYHVDDTSVDALGCWVTCLQLLNPKYNMITNCPLYLGSDAPAPPPLWYVWQLCHLYDEQIRSQIMKEQYEDMVLAAHPDCEIDEKYLDGYYELTHRPAEVINALIGAWTADAQGRFSLPSLWERHPFNGDVTCPNGYSLPLNIFIGDELYIELLKAGKTLPLPEEWRWW